MISERREEEPLQLLNYPCVLSLCFIILISVLLGMKISFVFAVFWISLLKTIKKLKFDINNLIELLGNLEFEVLSLTLSNIWSLAVNLSFDGFFRAPIDSFKSADSVIEKLISVLGIVLFPFSFLLALLYSIFELLSLKFLSQRKKLLVLFSEEAYFKLTRFPMKQRNNDLLHLMNCGIPGLLVVPQEVADYLVK